MTDVAMSEGAAQEPKVKDEEDRPAGGAAGDDAMEDTDGDGEEEEEEEVEASGEEKMQLHASLTRVQMDALRHQIAAFSFICQQNILLTQQQAVGLCKLNAVVDP
jgi:hypothetical protein